MSHTRIVRKESEKKEIEKEILAKVLMNLLRDEENRYCADCEAKGPRWASWNIGIFVCIRCAGIHRKLGVHISKVKSINLDSWTPEQVASMCGMGNSVAKAVYEHTLPDHFRRPQSDSALEAFIRSKYEQKRYIMKDWHRPDVEIQNLPCYTELMELRNNSTVRVRLSAPITTNTGSIHIPPPSLNTRPTIQSGQSGLIDLNSAPKQAEEQPSNMNDLLGLNESSATPQQATGTFQSSNGMDDLFGAFTTTQTTAEALPKTPTQTEAVSSAVKSNNDILALFASPPVGQLHPIAQNGVYVNQSIPTGVQQQMAGLNFQPQIQQQGPHIYQSDGMYQNAMGMQQLGAYAGVLTQLPHGVIQSHQSLHGSMLPMQMGASAIQHQHDLAHISPASKQKAPISDSAFKDIMSSGFFSNMQPSGNSQIPKTNAPTTASKPDAPVNSNELVDLFG